MSPLANAPSLFAILSALIEGRAGLHYGPEERDLFLERTSARASEAGFESLLDYYYYLRYDDAAAPELEKLIDALVVNETFFFRELQPLKMLVNRLVAPLVAKGRRPRIWSAACSSGEEPLTLAMLLEDAGLLDRVELMASDISTRALERARAGRFNRRSLRDPGEPRLAKKWIREGRDALQVDPALTAAISWQRINLCDPASLPAPESWDFILCRNVLIYFTDETTARVVAGLTRALKPDGALLVGVSESLMRFGSTLVCEELDSAFLYRKAS